MLKAVKQKIFKNIFSLIITLSLYLAGISGQRKMNIIFYSFQNGCGDKKRGLSV